MIDRYGRTVPYYAHVTATIDRWTISTRRIMDEMTELYDRITDPDLLIRRVTVVACNLIREDEIPPEEPYQLDFFTDYATLEQKKADEAESDEKEKRLQKATLELHEKFGKNAVLKGMNLQKGATTMQRNKQIGGHSAGE